MKELETATKILALLQDRTDLEKRVILALVRTVLKDDKGSILFDPMRPF